MPRNADIPALALSTQGTPRFDAPGVVPVRDATGAQLRDAGRSLQGLGAGIASETQDVITAQRAAQERYDTVRALEADNRAADVIRQTLHDPQAGYLTKVGRNALGTTWEESSKAMREQLQGIEKTLSTPEQKRRFQLSLADRLRDADTIAGDHYSRQERVYEIGETKAAIDGGVRDYLDKLGTPEARKEYEIALGHADRMAELAGGGPEMREQARTGVATRLHVAAVEEIVNRGKANPIAAVQAAESYWKAVREDVDPDARPQVDEYIKRQLKVADDGQGDTAAARYAVELDTSNLTQAQQQAAIDTKLQAGAISVDIA